MNERGYNQTELIAKKLEIPIETKCLIKTKNIKPQSTKTAKQRQIDIKNVFAIQNVDRIKNKKAGIFDVGIYDEILGWKFDEELLEQYNDISELKIGDKLIIPAVHETNQ